MGKRVIDEASLVSVADAIRDRAGTTEELVFPEGFESVVRELVNPVDYLAAVCNKTITELINAKIVTVPESFQKENKNLVKVELPALLALGSSVFATCSKLEEVDLPSVKTIGSGNFNGTAIKQIYMPNLETIDGWGYNFANCEKLTKASFPKLLRIAGDGTFGNCTALGALILGADSVCTLSSSGSSVFEGSAIANGTGYIYVPKALVDSYKAAWSTYASQFRAIEDYPDITGG